MGSPVIAVTLDGRLGNQMFQYAFALATAQKLGVSFCMLEDRYANLLPEYFQVPPKKPGVIFSLQQWLGLIPSISEQQDEMLTQFSKRAIYKGYWQNEQYFADCQQQIRRLLILRPSCQRLYKQHAVAKLDMANSIVLHVRMGDYVQWGSTELGGADLSLPASYYANALQALEWKGEPVIVVTDDPKAAKERLSFIPEMTLVHEHLIIDFQVLLHARKLIISNSSFAWWAAWLNPHQPTVMAPQHWIGFKVGKEYPHGVMAAAFTPVPVF